MAEPAKKVRWQPNPGPQTQFIASTVHEILYGGAAGGGKDLSLDTPIATPAGWSTMGDLAVGDSVFDRDGHPCRIVWKSDVLRSRCFELTFDTGETVIAGEGHEWVTLTDRERTQALRRDPARREARKLRRPSRAVERSAKPWVSKSVTAGNRARVHEYLPKPTGSRRTTLEIFETQLVRGHRVNHSIDVCGDLDLPEADLLVEPYLFGLWLGDGNSRTGSLGMLETDLDEVASHVSRPVHSRIQDKGVARKQQFTQMRWRDLTIDLRTLGVLGAKRIPTQYLRASIEQRRELLRGLLDTDGHCCARGMIELSLSVRLLAEDVLELVRSLGIKAQLQTKRLSEKSPANNYSHRMKFVAPFPAFKLPRKLARQTTANHRETTRRHYITSVREVPTVETQCIQVDAPSHTYLAGRGLIPTHNSEGLMVIPYRWNDVPDFQALILRRESTQLADLVRKGIKIYGALPKLTPHPRWRFGSGSLIQLNHCQHENDAFNYQGQEFNMLGIDELTHFTKTQYAELRSRVRGKKPRLVRATSNPGGEGHEWVFERWGPWLDPECETSGLPQRFDAEGEKMPPASPGQVLWVLATRDGEEYVPRGTPGATSRTFIAAKLDDNPELTREDPDYERRLLDNDPVRARQLRDGNWLIRYAAGIMFRRSMFRVVEAVPTRAIRVRSWDLAATEEVIASARSKKPGAVNDPDWTVGFLYGWAPDFGFFIEHIERVRGRPEVARKAIANITMQDANRYGRGAVLTTLPQDPGQAGKAQAMAYADMLSGHRVKIVIPTGSKVVRAGAASATADNAGISILRGPWNELFLAEAEQFPKGSHDDQIDTLSDAHEQIAELRGTWKANHSNDWSNLPDLS